MSKTKPGLGRGLDALINPSGYMRTENDSPDYSNVKPDDGKEINILAMIAIDLISSNPFQPRKNFDKEALEELKKSILSNGLIQPITVRRFKGNGYQLVSGERRLKAFQEIGYKEIPAYIIQVDSDEIMLALALIENIQREKLNPIEIGNAYKRLMDECHLTQEQIAERVGKDRTTVANSIRLLKLPEKIQDSLINGEISSGHARALINLPEKKLQLKALEQIKENNLSVRKVEQLVKDLITPEKKTGNKNNFSGTTTVADPNIKELEDRLRRTFGTKVVCRQKKDGSGNITIEFYSNDEMERILEMFEIIGKTYS